MDRQSSHNLGAIDLLRGVSAAWVLLGHLYLYVTGKSLVWGAVTIAVDVFMLISGFLMVYHWQLRKNNYPDAKSQTNDFYIRRFFRIAPLYYVLLTIAFLGQDFFVQCAQYVIGIANPPIDVQLLSFKPPQDMTIDLINLLMHYSFLFGFFPAYAANTVLPDWSLGLEMQFYLVLPFIMMFWKKYWVVFVVLGSVALSQFINSKVGLHLYEGPWGNFPQASLILFKINIFVAGGCLANVYLRKSQKEIVAHTLLSFVALMNAPVQVHLAALFLVAVFAWRIQITHPFLDFMSQSSYAVYLVHELIFFPGLFMLYQMPWFNGQGDIQRFMISLLMVPIVYAIARLLYRTVELPGIRWGQKLTQRMESDNVAA